MRNTKLLSKILTIKKCSFIFLWLLFYIALNSCNSSQKKVIKSQMVDSIYNAGQLKLTDTLLKHTFYIKNIGNADMSIDSVVTSCDCMTLNWQKTPVHPGETGFVNVAVKPYLNSKGKKIKYVMVRTNSLTPILVFQIFFTL